MTDQCRYCGRQASSERCLENRYNHFSSCNDSHQCRAFLAERVESLQAVVDMATGDFMKKELDSIVGVAFKHGWTTDRESSGIAEFFDAKVASLTRDRDQLKLRLLSAAGDDLCRLSQEEIKELSAGRVQIPPKEEFIASCERFHAQLVAGPGVLDNCLTLAQLIAENQKLEADRDEWKWKAELFDQSMESGAVAMGKRLKALEAERDAAIKRAEEAERSWPKNRQEFLLISDKAERRGKLLKRWLDQWLKAMRVFHSEETPIEKPSVVRETEEEIR